jgi:hypothetical protein
MKEELKKKKDFEEINRGLLEIVSRNLHRETEKTIAFLLTRNYKYYILASYCMYSNLVILQHHNICTVIQCVGVCGGQSGTGAGFLRVLHFPLGAIS